MTKYMMVEAYGGDHEGLLGIREIFETLKDAKAKKADLIHRRVYQPIFGDPKEGDEKTAYEAELNERFLIVKVC